MGGSELPLGLGRAVRRRRGKEERRRQVVYIPPITSIFLRFPCLGYFLDGTHFCHQFVGQLFETPKRVGWRGEASMLESEYEGAISHSPFHCWFSSQPSRVSCLEPPKFGASPSLVCCSCLVLAFGATSYRARCYIFD